MLMQKLRLFSLLCVLIYTRHSFADWTKQSGSDPGTYVFTNSMGAARINQLSITVLGEAHAVLDLSFSNPFFRLLFQQDLDMAAPVTNDRQISVRFEGEERLVALRWIRLREPELCSLLAAVFPE